MNCSQYEFMINTPKQFITWLVWQDANTGWKESNNEKDKMCKARNVTRQWVANFQVGDTDESYSEFWEGSIQIGLKNGKASVKEKETWFCKDFSNPPSGLLFIAKNG